MTTKSEQNVYSKSSSYFWCTHHNTVYLTLLCRTVFYKEIYVLAIHIGCLAIRISCAFHFRVAHWEILFLVFMQVCSTHLCLHFKFTDPIPCSLLVLSPTPEGITMIPWRPTGCLSCGAQKKTAVCQFNSAYNPRLHPGMQKRE